MSLFGLGAVQPGMGRTIWPAVQVSVQGCEPDNRFESTDPRYVLLTGNVQDALHIAFPKSYYVWCQEHLWWRVNHKPPPGASARERVIWALDVWSTTQLGLMALNTPMGPATPRTFGFDRTGALRSPDPKWIDQYCNGDPALEAVYRANVEFYGYMGIARDNGIQANKRVAMNDAIRQRIAQAPLRPAPFTTMVPWWYGVPTRFQDVSAGYDNTLRNLVDRACIPWMVAGFQLPSKDNKDAQLFSAYGADPEMLTALRQWRIWSLRQLFPWSRDEKFRDRYDAPSLDLSSFPRFMGTVKDTVNLDVYINRVSTEPTRQSVVGTEQGWYPTLQSVIDTALPGMAGVVMGTDYDRAVRQRVQAWMDKVKPPLDADGNVLKDAQGRPYRVGVTCEDYNDILDEHIARIEARVHAGVDQISEGGDPDTCRGQGMGLEQACRRLQEWNAQTIQKFPVIKQITQIATFLMHKAVDLLGAAVAGGGPPFWVLPQPFVRVVDDLRYSTAIEGSTATTLGFVTNAMMWVQATLDIWIVPFSPDPNPPLQDTQTCSRVMKDAQGLARCVSDVAGDCEAIVWDKDGQAVCLSRDTPEEFRARTGQAPPDCSAIVTGYEQKHAAVLTRAARIEAVAMCQQEVAGQLPAGAAEAYVQRAKNVGRVPSVRTPSSFPWLWLAGAAAAVAIVKRRR